MGIEMLVHEQSSTPFSFFSRPSGRKISMYSALFVVSPGETAAVVPSLPADFTVGFQSTPAYRSVRDKATTMTASPLFTSVQLVLFSDLSGADWCLIGAVVLVSGYETV